MNTLIHHISFVLKSPPSTARKAPIAYPSLKHPENHTGYFESILGKTARHFRTLTPDFPFESCPRSNSAQTCNAKNNLHFFHYLFAQPVESFATNPMVK
jgi:hypothetical protein